MRDQYLRLHAPEPEPKRPVEKKDGVVCPDSTNPYPDFEGSTIFEEDDEEKENSHVVIIQL